jgi:8-oxo-dGTP diphosphatase
MMSHWMEDSSQHCYDFPRPALTVDIVLFRETPAGWKILLIRRKVDPFAGSWALPGGFVDEMEPLEKAAQRELREETGLEAPSLVQMRTYGDPGRDPRGHTVSVVYVGIDDEERSPRAADDAAEAAWLPAQELPPMAFDHDRIVREAVEWVQRNRPDGADRGGSSRGSR